MKENQCLTLLSPKEIIAVFREVQGQTMKDQSTIAHAIVSAAVHAHQHGDVTCLRSVLEAIPVRSPKRKQVREWFLKFAPVVLDNNGALIFQRPSDAKHAEARAEAVERCRQAAHLIFGSMDSHAESVPQARTLGDYPLPKDTRRFDLKDELAKLITRAERAKLGILTTGAVSVDDMLLKKLKAVCPVSWDKP